MLRRDVGIEEAVVIALLGLCLRSPAKIGAPRDMALVEHVVDVDVVGELELLKVAAAVGAEAHPLEPLERRTVDIPGHAGRITALLAQPDREMAIPDLAVAIERGEVVASHLGELGRFNVECEE